MASVKNKRSSKSQAVFTGGGVSKQTSLTESTPKTFRSQNRPTCIELSDSSEAAWKRSLRSGCLNKGLGEKLRLFSHIPRLANLKLESSNIPTSVSYDWNRRDALGSANDSDISDKIRSSLIEEETSETSLIIVLDLRKPIQAEGRRLQIETNNFFPYLMSDAWKKDSCLSVVSGPLLSLVLETLTKMNLSGMLMRSTFRTLQHNASDRDNERDSQTSRRSKTLKKKELKDLRVSSKKVYETLQVQTSLFRPAHRDVTSLKGNRKLFPDIEFNGSQENQIENFDSSFELRPIKINRFCKIPEFETINTQQNIDILNTELKNLVKRKSREQEENMILNKTKGGEKEKTQKTAAEKMPGFKSEKQDSYLMFPLGGNIEEISIEPCFLLEKKVDSAPSVRSSIKIQEKTKSMMETKVSLAEDKVDITRKDIEKLPDIVDGSSISRADEEETSAKSISDNFLTEISELTESEEETEWAKINFYSQELYVSSLCRPRRLNKETCAEKMKRLNKLRQKQRDKNVKIIKTIRDANIENISLKYDDPTEEKSKSSLNILPGLQVSKTQSKPDNSDWEKFEQENEKIGMHAAINERFAKKSNKRESIKTVSIDSKVMYDIAETSKSKAPKKGNKNANKMNNSSKETKENINVNNNMHLFNKTSSRKTEKRLKNLKRLDSSKHFSGNYNKNYSASEGEISVKDSISSKVPSLSRIKSDGSKLSIEEEHENESLKTISSSLTPTPPVPLSKCETMMKRANEYNCKCFECLINDEFIDPLRRPCEEFLDTYPILPGLTSKKMGAEAKTRSSLNPEQLMKADTKNHFDWLAVTDVAENLLLAMDQFIVRKELLSSSLGFSYSVVTFTRPDFYHL